MYFPYIVARHTPFPLRLDLPAPEPTLQMPASHLWVIAGQAQLSVQGPPDAHRGCKGASNMAPRQ